MSLLWWGGVKKIQQRTLRLVQTAWVADFLLSKSTSYNMECLVLTKFCKLLKLYNCTTVWREETSCSGSCLRYSSTSHFIIGKMVCHYLSFYPPLTYIPRLRWIDPPSNFLPDTMHTAGLDTIFIQTQGRVPGVSKELERHKDQYLDVFLR